MDRMIVAEAAYALDVALKLPPEFIACELIFVGSCLAALLLWKWRGPTPKC